MKKLIVTLLMAMVLISFSYADSIDKVLDKVDATNEKITQTIDKTVLKSETMISKIGTDINAKDLEKIDKLVEKLIDQTNKMSLKTRTDAAKQGVIVVCDWIDVEINGVTYSVDPLRVYCIHR